MKKGYSQLCSCNGPVGIGVIIVVLIALVGASACHKTDALDLAKKATEEQNAGRYDAAVATWTKAIELGTLGKDNLAIAYIRRGVAYREKKQYDRAIEDYNKAIELNPGDARVYVGRAAVYSMNGQYDRVVEDCSKALELDPKLADAYINRGRAYFGKQQYDRAIEDYNKAIDLDPKYARGYHNRGNAYIGKKQYSRAIEDYNKAIELDQKYAASYYNKACVYSLMNNTQESCRWLGTAVEKGFTDWNAIKADSDLNNIRSSACYKELMAGK
jgi:tetratricopeptide (TPR) repeat protein